MILVVEDDSRIRMFITINLRARGHQVLSVESAEEALEAIQREIPSLMMLDVRLPGMSGLEFLGYLNDDHTCADFPVVLMSAYPLEDEVVNVPRVIQFLRKPVGVQDVVQAVSHALSV